jgi:hypothetical protein
MTFFAITKGSAEWLLGKSGVMQELSQVLQEPQSVINCNSSTYFSEGPFRLAAITDPSIIVFWNIDYLTGKGQESWGMIRLSGPCGLNSFPDISREVFERSLYVVSQRLNGLLLDSSFIHRPYSNGAHTCLAGRGVSARQYSIAYYEKHIDSEASPRNTVMCIGPAQDFVLLSNTVKFESLNLDSLAVVADDLLSTIRSRTQVSHADYLALRNRLKAFSSEYNNAEFNEVEVSVSQSIIDPTAQLRSIGFSYDDWIRNDSPLSDVQRRILSGDSVCRQPLRIVGPAGSGKTLLMQLLVARLLRQASERRESVRIIYITHNTSMANMVSNRFEVLRRNESDTPLTSDLRICTLAEYGITELGLDVTQVIDKDAFQSKQYQLEQVLICLGEIMDECKERALESRLFKAAIEDLDMRDLVAKMIMSEISIGIKGNNLEADRKRYVESSKSLSRFHAALDIPDRSLVFSVFERYQQLIFESLEVLDSDDVALSLLGRVRTPIWELKRKTLGYDYIFIDETQLFNENERRVLPYISNGATKHVPIVLALDEAQDLFGNSQSAAGLATLGIVNIANESLTSIHRSTRAIIRLAFFVIQRSTDLFGPDFPDFTNIADSMDPTDNPLAMHPCILEANRESRNIGKYTLKQIRALRSENIRQIAVIVHVEVYWQIVVSELNNSDLPLQILEERGIDLPAESPVVVVSRPEHCGGQEFDAVLLVGLEQGNAPQGSLANVALSTAIEQQMIREVYLAVTRARYRVYFILASGALPNGLISDALAAGFVVCRR